MTRHDSLGVTPSGYEKYKIKRVRKNGDITTAGMFYYRWADGHRFISIFKSEQFLDDYLSDDSKDKYLFMYVSKFKADERGLEAKAISLPYGEDSIKVGYTNVSARGNLVFAIKRSYESLIMLYANIERDVINFWIGHVKMGYKNDRK